MNNSPPLSFLGEKCYSEAFKNFCFANSIIPEFKLVGNTYHCAAYQQGIEYSSVDSIIIDTVMFFLKGGGVNKDMLPYKGPIPFGLSLGMSKDKVAAKFGTPSKSGGPEIFLGMKIPAWDRFEIDDQLILRVPCSRLIIGA